MKKHLPLILLVAISGQEAWSQTPTEPSPQSYEKVYSSGPKTEHEPRKIEIRTYVEPTYRCPKKYDSPDHPAMIYKVNGEFPVGSFLGPAYTRRDQREMNKRNPFTRYMEIDRALTWGPTWHGVFPTWHPNSGLAGAEFAWSSELPFTVYHVEHEAFPFQNPNFLWTIQTEGEGYKTDFSEIRGSGILISTHPNNPFDFTPDQASVSHRLRMPPAKWGSDGQLSSLPDDIPQLKPVREDYAAGFNRYGKSSVLKVKVTDGDSISSDVYEADYKVNWHLPYERQADIHKLPDPTVYKLIDVNWAPTDGDDRTPEDKAVERLLKNKTAKVAAAGMYLENEADGQGWKWMVNVIGVVANGLDPLPSMAVAFGGILLGEMGETGSEYSEVEDIVTNDSALFEATIEAERQRLDDPTNSYSNPLIIFDNQTIDTKKGLEYWDEKDVNGNTYRRAAMFTDSKLQDIYLLGKFQTVNYAFESYGGDGYQGVAFFSNQQLMKTKYVASYTNSYNPI